jgi:2-polyprenyl-6-hydroxyphenyl methylase/3-demethylubiquinone-9 3-methyltransferase
MWPLAALPFLLQGGLMLIDEGFHLRRGLPAWERWGHPLDTFLAAACFAMALRAPVPPAGLGIYAIVAALACLSVTKDEWVHARHCSGIESWLHACLFMLHPVVLAIAGIWAFGGAAYGMRGEGHAGFGIFLAVQTALTVAFGLWQIAYWNGPWGRARPVFIPARPEGKSAGVIIGSGSSAMASAATGPGNVSVTGSGPLPPASARGDRAVVNNAFYDGLGDAWHDAWDHPVALLRAEAALKNPWVGERLRAFSPGRPCRVLDVGCGAGFLAASLAGAGHRVIGLDVSVGSLKVARGAGILAVAGPAYLAADAYRLPFPDAAFDAVCALDFLEHVSSPAQVIDEAARVLRPGGLFFFHTFNRNLLSLLVVIKGVEWFVRGVPRHMHVLPLFIKPAELASMCIQAGMRLEEIRGMAPAIGAPFWKLLATRSVPRDFRFRFTRSLALGYVGSAIKAG